MTAPQKPREWIIASEESECQVRGPSTSGDDVKVIEQSAYMELVEALKFYAGGAKGSDHEVRPKYKEIWNDPKRWHERSMSHFFIGKKAREILTKHGIKNIEERT